MILGLFGFLHITLVDLLDIVMVAAIIYFLFHWIKGTSAMNIFVAIMILLVIRIIADALGMKMMSSLLGAVLDMGAVAIVIIFQPEIRKALGRIGRSAGSTLEKRNFFEKLFQRRMDRSIGSNAADEIAQACSEMSAQMTGALIVIRRDNSLEDIIATGDTIDAEVVRRLIMNIFFKNSPLHDGAMVIGGDRIIAARCTLPISERTDLPAHYGMRHKAAVGLTEQSDAEVVVVSEQTGAISYVRGGVITQVSSINALKLLLKGNEKEER